MEIATAGLEHFRSEEDSYKNACFAVWSQTDREKDLTFESGSGMRPAGVEICNVRSAVRTAVCTHYQMYYGDMKV